MPRHDIVMSHRKHQVNFGNSVDTVISIQLDTREPRVHRYKRSLHAQPPAQFGP